MRETVAPRTAAPSTTKHRFTVRFYRRMKLQRVYATVVEARLVGGGQTNGAGAPVLLRPIIPGAHVVPVEQTLDTAQTGARATFYVTPLAKGKLAGARLEVRRQDVLVQEIRLPMRATTQRMTWLLALLTVLLPFVLLNLTRYHKLQGIVRRPVLPAAAPAPRPAAPEKKDQPAPDPKQDAVPPGPNPGPGRPPTTRLPGPVDLLTALIGLVDDDQPKKSNPPGEKKDEAKDANKDAETVPPPKEAGEKKAVEGKDAKDESKQEGARGMGGRQPDRGGRGRAGGGGGGPPRLEGPPPLPRPDPNKPAPMPTERKGEGGEILEKEILENVPEVPAWLRERNVPPLTEKAAALLGQGYDLLCVLAETDDLCFWVGLVLLGLTLISWIMHRSLSGRRTGAPVVL
jgi:hypothetical protein